jgi:hypothetical protein
MIVATYNAWLLSANSGLRDGGPDFRTAVSLRFPG